VVQDILFRMLQPHELAAGMGFPPGYVFKGTRGEVVKQIGNAVEVNKARAHLAELLRAVAA
jgi:DNA (cytosine-5)-methyltransferase 1